MAGAGTRALALACLAITGFALQGRRSAAKFVLFDHAERHGARPIELRPGCYAFELFHEGHAFAPAAPRA